MAVVVVEEDRTLYPVFLALRTKDGIDEELTLTKRQADFKIPDQDFFKINADHSGIYRTSYTPARLEKLGKAAKDGLLSVEDRAGMIADAGALAASGYQKTSGVLALLKSFDSESKFVVWDEITTRIALVRDAWTFEDSKTQDALRAFQRELVSSKAHKAGWNFTEGEDHVEQQFKTLLFAAAGLSGDKTFVHLIYLFESLLTRFVELLMPLLKCLESLAKVIPMLFIQIFEVVSMRWC